MLNSDLMELKERLVEWIAENLTPEEVFSDKALEEWAEENGWVQAEE